MATSIFHALSVRDEESAPLHMRWENAACLMKRFWVYLMSSKSRRLCAGMTIDLPARVIDHKFKLYPESC